MGKDTFKYLGVCMGIYLALAAIEFFLLRPLVDFFGTGVYTPLIVYLIILVLVDPILTRMISDLMGFKELNKDGDLQ
ncbi:MAG: hypothetical protein IJI46_03330 [Erysipelotrichaceae bacterium]|nr:hypothetical protein [Erysipelotrichaceae bacterium]